jgi:hypothetical protein
MGKDIFLIHFLNIYIYSKFHPPTSLNNNCNVCVSVGAEPWQTRQPKAQHVKTEANWPTSPRVRRTPSSREGFSLILYIKATELRGWLACPRRPNCLICSIYGGICFLPHDPTMILVTPGQSVRSGPRSVTDGSGDGARGLLESSPITHEEISLTPPCWSWALAPPFSPSDSLSSRQSLAPLPPLSLHPAPCHAPSRHPVPNPFSSSLNRPRQLPLKARLHHVLRSTRS